MNNGIDIRGFKLLYNKQVWNPIGFNMEFDAPCDDKRLTIDRPKYLSVVVLDSDGKVRVLHDQSFMFQFVKEHNEENDRNQIDQSWDCPFCGAGVEWWAPRCNNCGCYIGGSFDPKEEIIAAWNQCNTSKMKD